MHIIALYAILTAGLTAAAPSTFLPSHAVEKRACRQIAICKNDNPQVGDTSDIAYIAQDMRSFGRASAGTQLAFFSSRSL
jgi:hypothetical protein